MTGSIDRLFHADKEKIKYFERGAVSALLVYRYAQANPLFAIEPSENSAILSHLPLTTSYSGSGAVKLVGHLVCRYRKALNQNIFRLEFPDEEVLHRR
jgi:hypothetical protein